MAGKIFISYRHCRRSGSPKDANMVFSHLSSVFGAEHVFIDVDAIRPGDDFVEVLEQQLTDCTVLLALIGPDWLQACNESGKRKLDDDDDFVRLEIRTALRRGIRVVPLLLDGALMPRREELPEDLHPMTRLHGHPVDAADLHNYRSAMVRLEDVLRKELNGVDPISTAGASGGRSAILETLEQLRSAGHLGIEPWMFAEGHDIYGRWAELSVNGAVQRLRWIASGYFRMGSPPAEAEREQNEGPQHEVALTRGFWLADTACTQALWQKVVGENNPSQFIGDSQRPVERVSWDDVTQKFLPRLNDQLVGAVAELPTEAEWEYACRAGGVMAYSFGELIYTDRVNYDGNFPSMGGKKGSCLKKTVAVKERSENAWGLYQMHGNVREWCVDAKRCYTEQSMVDPHGGQDGPKRVIRGGSWHDEASRCRSAYRCNCSQDYRGDFLGFRFALRSIEPGAGGGR